MLCVWFLLSHTEARSSRRADAVSLRTSFYLSSPFPARLHLAACASSGAPPDASIIAAPSYAHLKERLGFAMKGPIVSRIKRNTTNQNKPYFQCVSRLPRRCSHREGQAAYAPRRQHRLADAIAAEDGDPTNKSNIKQTATANLRELRASV